MSDRRVKTAVIGLNVGLSHVQAYQQLPDAELVALCDISEPWLRHCQQAYRVPEIYTDYRQMLAQASAEAVSVCLPVHLHLPVTLDCLAAGRHVLVEKPIAANAAEARQMAAAAQAAERVLMISQNQRFGPEARFLKRFVESGGLGHIYFARAVWRRPLGMLPTALQDRATGAYDRNWFNEAAKGGGVGRDLGAHIIDFALWIMGHPPVADVTGRAYAHFGTALAQQHGTRFDVDDHTVGFVRFANGASLQIETSFGQHTDQEVLLNEFYGTRGGAVRDGGSLRLFGEMNGAYTTTTPRLAEPPDSTQAHFVTCIRGGRSPSVTAEQGVQLMEIIDGLYRSSSALAV
jgi:predicted dehydrogenase